MATTSLPLMVEHVLGRRRAMAFEMSDLQCSDQSWAMFSFLMRSLSFSILKRLSGFCSEASLLVSMV